RTTAALLSGRRDVIVVSSVSCLYGMADPKAFEEKMIHINVGDRLERAVLMRKLVESYYINNKVEFNSGNFRVRGDTIDIFPAVEGYDGVAYRVSLWDDEVERIATFNPVTGQEYGPIDQLNIYPANLFVTTKEQVNRAVSQIDVDLGEQCRFFEEEGKPFEAKRLYERVTYDLEMIRELGYCSGIENYSRYFDGRSAGQRPFCLLDYFPDDYLLVIDESHVTIPQIHAMYGGDRARKENLVSYGFRLPAAMDNRPLKYEEFIQLTPQTIYVSATPADYELQRAEGVVVEQVIRPTGLLDPIIEVRPIDNQIDDLEEEINLRIEKNQRVLITTLTKRMAEELSDYLIDHNFKAAYIHSDVDTLERVRIMDDLRSGVYDILIGVNLLREGLDLPEVSLVAILDADKEGFLRSHRALTQTAGRAARHLEGKVIFYADKITDSMRLTMEETARRRKKQDDYNKANGITPKQIVKNAKSILSDSELEITDKKGRKAYIEEQHKVSTNPIIQELSADKLKDLIEATRTKMLKAAKDLDFAEAADLRDEMLAYEDQLKKL
ncbi:MAG: excinuclease ABC subunit UvrB, partial [Porphyromonadaceae bacterium]|nr:excinuclease ABC subunit UvrB [Porphyromonadaceae bacterium]